MREMESALKMFRDVEIVSAKKCAIEKVANKYRFEILLRAEKATHILKAIAATKVDLAEIDMDPVEFA
jgi:primosomal protein N' (replication factor Y)